LQYIYVAGLAGIVGWLAGYAWLIGYLNHRRPTMEMDWVKEVLKLCAGVGLVAMMVALVMSIRTDWGHVGPGLPVFAGIMGGLGCFLLLNFLARIFVLLLHARSSSGLATS
jgi:biotin transporter BioY